MKKNQELDFIEKVKEEFQALKLTAVRVFDRRELSSLTDFYLLATAESLTQLESARSRILPLAKQQNYVLRNPNESYKGGWLILDLGDLILNIFTEEARAFYQLDHFLETGEVDLENIKHSVRV